MKTCLFASFVLPANRSLEAGALAKIAQALRGTPSLDKALIHTPSHADDPYRHEAQPPHLVLQLYFAELSALEATLSDNGGLRLLLSRAEFPELADADVVHQAMLVRSFAVPEPQFRNDPGEPCCTYLVSYEGEAEDLNAWHRHYLERHTRHMVRFPGLRELEIYTRLDWVSAMPWRRVNFMQRNKVVFDSAAALNNALHSPVRHEMRADYNTFPAFTGPNRHYAMATRAV